MASPPTWIDFLTCLLGVIVSFSPMHINTCCYDLKGYFLGFGSRVCGLMVSIAGKGSDLRDPRTRGHIFSFFAGCLCGGSMLQYVLKVELAGTSCSVTKLVKGGAYGATGLVNLILLGFLLFRYPKIRKVLRCTLIAAVTIGFICYSIDDKARTYFDTTVPLEIMCLVSTVAMNILQFTSQDASQGSDHISAYSSVVGLPLGFYSCATAWRTLSDHRTFKIAVVLGGLFNILDAIVLCGSKWKKVRHLLQRLHVAHLLPLTSTGDLLQLTSTVDQIDRSHQWYVSSF